MADTTTTNLSLVKPEVGASANTWGGKINDNLDDLDALFPSGDLAVLHGGTGASTAAGARTSLGLVIGTDVAPVVSPTFTGTPAAPTASPGTNTTQLATTAFVTVALQALYPVGSVYINASVTTNPATLLGFGTWVAFGAGRVMVGLNGSDTLFDTLEETGGSKDAIVVSHTHGVTDSGHTHTQTADGSLVTNYTLGGDGPIDESRVAGFFDRNLIAASISTATTGITVNSTGSPGTNANLQPYVVVKMWKRTA
jgi:hypothetical protein